MTRQDYPYDELLRFARAFVDRTQRLLDCRGVTTHWLFADDFSAQFPKIKVSANSLFLKDGPVLFAAGITAGIDLSLAPIEEDYGSRVTLGVARELVAPVAGTVLSACAVSGPGSRSSDRLRDVASWIVSNLKEDLSVEGSATKPTFAFGTSAVCLS